MRMIDAFAGLGGASQAMRARGWDVLTVDNNPAFECDVTADILDWHYTGPLPVDLGWFSVPCPEFARLSMPWTRRNLPTGFKPSMDLYNAARRLIAEIQPRYWVIENVRGAVPYFGRPAAIVGPFYLWGHFPPLGKPMLNMRQKESYSSKQQAERAMIPYALSEAVALACERAMKLEFAL